MKDTLLTESRDERFAATETMRTEELMLLINSEDAKVHEAVRATIPAIARAVDEASSRMKRGGRLIYVGAGTSGRLGVLDASECPPTYGVPPELVQGHMAGGPEAIIKAREGAEDDAEAGRALMERLGVSELDSVVGISASGGAAFVIAAVKAARGRGAYTAALTSNEGTKLSAAAEETIAPITGPEVVAGSTRMKCGTAQKLVLNMLSTGCMIKLGRVRGGQMTDMRATNEKLRQRGIGIVARAAGVDEGRAKAALEANDMDVGRAIAALEGEK